MTNTIAIDFGTSRTKLAYLDTKRQKAELMWLGDDRQFIPSVFYLEADSACIYLGEDAEEMLKHDPAGIINVLKRQLRSAHVRANRRKIEPIDLLAHLLKELRERSGKEVAAFEDQPPSHVCLTLPALYGPPDEKLLRDAAQKAGFDAENIKLMSEPVAAARAWLAETDDSESEVIVLDCGGSTVDWAYLRREGDNFHIVADCPPGGDRNVGGLNVDQELLEQLKETLSEGELDKLNKRHTYYLRKVCHMKERYCRELPLKKMKIGQLSEQTIQEVIERRFIDQACESLKGYLSQVKAINDGNVPTVLLVGGSARLKGLADALQSHCDCKTVWWERSEYATVLGAVPLISKVKVRLYNSAHQYIYNLGGCWKIISASPLRDYSEDFSRYSQMDSSILDDIASITMICAEKTFNFILAKKVFHYAFRLSYGSAEMVFAKEFISTLIDNFEQLRHHFNKVNQLIAELSGTINKIGNENANLNIITNLFILNAKILGIAVIKTLKEISPLEYNLYKLTNDLMDDFHDFICASTRHSSAINLTKSSEFNLMLNELTDLFVKLHLTHDFVAMESLINKEVTLELKQIMIWLEEEHHREQFNPY